jgi:hypothetical protein
MRGDCLPNCSNVTFNNAGIRIIGLDTHLGYLIWSLEPILPINSNTNDVIRWIRLLSSYIDGHSTQSLLVSLSSGLMYVWDIDTVTGTTIGQHCASSSSSSAAPAYRIQPPVRQFNNIYATNVQGIPGSPFSYLLVTKFDKSFLYLYFT